MRPGDSKYRGRWSNYKRHERFSVEYFSLFTAAVRRGGPGWTKEKSKEKKTRHYRTRSMVRRYTAWKIASLMISIDIRGYLNNNRTRRWAYRNSRGKVDENNNRILPVFVARVRTALIMLESARRDRPEELRTPPDP